MWKVYALVRYQRATAGDNASYQIKMYPVQPVGSEAAHDYKLAKSVKVK